MAWQYERVLVQKPQAYAYVSQPNRRWATRIINTIVVLIPPIIVAVMIAADPSHTALEAVIFGYGVSFLSAAVVGLFYGRGWSPGHLIARTTSRRTRDGRVSGAFRGMLRFVVFPGFWLFVWMLFESAGSLVGWSDDVIVTDRTLQEAPEGVRS